jgi:hypothetical protein
MGVKADDNVVDREVAHDLGVHRLEPSRATNSCAVLASPLNPSITASAVPV